MKILTFTFGTKLSTRPRTRGWNKIGHLKKKHILPLVKKNHISYKIQNDGKEMIILPRAVAMNRSFDRLD